MRPNPTNDVARLLAICACFLAAQLDAQAQDDLSLIDARTEVSRISFRFVDGRLIAPDRLTARMATRAPNGRDRLKRRLSFLPGVSPGSFPFDPVQLQRDMTRLRRFYEQNGFLGAQVDYPATQFDQASNRVHVIISVREGPPLVVGERSLVGENLLPPDLLASWDKYRSRLPLAPGQRYTEFERLRMSSETSAWLKDRGFAFAQVTTVAAVDSVAGRVSLEHRFEPGPRAVFGSIEIRGQESVSDGILRRQLPFRPGDDFSASQLMDGQRALFGLNLFRVAVAELPEQPVDGTVDVVFTVREARPRYQSVRVGYSRDNGFALDGEWRHRNFLGGARQLSVASGVQSGFAARPPAGRAPVRSVASSVSLRQPYMGVRRLSGLLAVYHTYMDDENQRTRYHEFGISPSLLLELYPFRTASLQYGLARAIPLGSLAALNDIGVFDKSIISGSWTVGWLNNYLTPRRGWILRPTAEMAGIGLARDFSYVRGSLEGTAYVPVTRRTNVVFGLTVGRLQPTRASRNQSDPETEYRFDAVRFYAGGATDVRGWGLNALGPRVARADSAYVDDSGGARASGARFEPVGAKGKLRGSVEVRVPIPGLSDSWRFGLFTDFGALSARLVRDSEGRTQFDANDEPLVEETLFPALSDLRFGAGGGLRYKTPVGSVRLDVAMKLNPSGSDLQSAEQAVLYRTGLRATPPDEPFLRRLNVHLSIDRAF